MERLTKYLASGAADYNYPVDCYGGNDCNDRVAKSAYRQTCVERLAAYEDRGYAPEEILPKDKADEIALKLMRLADLESLCSYTRLRELAEADKDGRLGVLPCKAGDTVIDQTFAENPRLMKNTRLEIAYESRCGIIFHMGYDIFADLVEHGRIKPVSEEAEKVLEAMTDD